MTKSETSPTQKMLNVWAIILIIWSLYRATFKTGLHILFDEFIAKPIVFLFPIFWFIAKLEKKPVFQSIGFSKKNIYMDVIFGVGIGCLFLGVAVLVRILKGLPFSSFHFSAETLIWAVSTVMAATTEQILSTGFVFKRLSEESKGIIRPLVLSALLFFFLHIPALFGVDKTSGSTLVQMMVLNTVLSLTTSIVFLMRKNTLSPIIVYAFYLLSLPILL